MMTQPMPAEISEPDHPICFKLRITDVFILFPMTVPCLTRADPVLHMLLSHDSPVPNKSKSFTTHAFSNESHA